MPSRDSWDCPDCTGVPTLREDGLTVLTHSDGCPVGRALDHMSDTDRAWFDAHPDASEYWRDLLPGDFGIGSLSCIGSIDGQPLRVRVRQIADGVRVRSLPGNAYVMLGTEDGIRLAHRLGILAGVAS